MAKVTGTFGATGQSSVIIADRVDISVSGAASATIGIQRRVDGTNWTTVESITGDFERVIENAGPMGVRLNCSAYTSGTATYVMAG